MYAVEPACPSIIYNLGLGYCFDSAIKKDLGQRINAKYIIYTSITFSSVRKNKFIPCTVSVQSIGYENSQKTSCVQYNHTVVCIYPL